MVTKIVIIGLLAAVVTLGVWWRIENYRECRAFGHSVRYCLSQR